MTDVRLPSAEGRWRALAALVAAALVLAMFPLGLAHAEDRVNMTQLSGSDNVAAAVAWSKHAFTTEAKNVVLGRSDLPPDNLASGLLQGVLDAPLLLTPSNSLHASVEAELERLKAVTVHILGGLSAISASVESKLRSEGYAVRRYSGTTRIETAVAIANAQAGAATTALLARAFGTSADPTSAWADALAGGAWAADDSFPVLFTQTETLTASTKDYLTSSRIRTVNILGGTSAVSQAVEDQLKAMNIAVKRVSGATRFATAIAIAKERGFDTAGDTDVTSIVLADGQHTDGWAAGFAAAGFAEDKPIVLSNGSALPAETDSWFAGAAAADKLIVAPYVTEAAAKAAADKMGLLKKAAVTLDSTSFPNNGNITGKVTPMDDVKSVTVSGPCVTDGTVTPNATTGAFSLPISQSFAPGSCALTFTVTYDNDSTQTNPLTVTITGPGPNATVMDGPELTTVAVNNQTDDHVVVKYTFDEAVTIVDDPLNPDDFHLVGFDGTLLPPAAPAGDRIRPEGNSVLASYGKQDFLMATTAVVEPGAVKGTTSQIENPEGSRPLQNVVFDAGRTVRPDLVSVSVQSTPVNRGTTAAPEWAARAVFTFDIAATARHEDQYRLMTQAGDWHSAIAVVSGDGSTTHHVDFGIADGTASFGNTDADKTTASTFIGNVRRGMIEFEDPADPDPDEPAVEDRWGQDNISQTVNVGSGAHDMPKLTKVTPLPATNQVRYTFASAINQKGDGSTFFIYTHGGEVINGSSGAGTVTEETTSGSVMSVLVDFGDGDIDEAVSGGGTHPAAVEDAVAPVNDAEFQSLPADDGAETYASGLTLAPDLVTVIRAASSADPFGGGQATQYKVTYRFNKAVAAVTDANFRMYAKDGTAVDFTNECVEGQTTATAMDVVCTVDDTLATAATFAAVKNAVLFAVEAAAVKTKDVAADYNNYPTSKVPSSS